MRLAVALAVNSHRARFDRASILGSQHVCALLNLIMASAHAFESHDLGAANHLAGWSGRLIKLSGALCALVVRGTQALRFVS
jgi:hypothetical protein